MTTHKLKVWPEYFKALKDGTKTFDVRLNDRNFQIGDLLILQEWNPPTKSYTGQEIERKIVYILGGTDAQIFGIREGYCVLGLEVVSD